MEAGDAFRCSGADGPTDRPPELWQSRDRWAAIVSMLNVIDIVGAPITRLGLVVGCRPAGYVVEGFDPEAGHSADDGALHRLAGGSPVVLHCPAARAGVLRRASIGPMLLIRACRRKAVLFTPIAINLGLHAGKGGKGPGICFRV